MKRNWIIMAFIPLLMATATIGLCITFPNAANNPESGLVIWLPQKIVNFEAQEVPLSEQEKFWLPQDTTQLKMRYRPWRGSEREKFYEGFSATLILAGSDRRSLHRPEVCMVGQGWTVEKREVVSIQTAGGILEVMDLWLKMPIESEDGRQSFRKAHYVYWWVAKNGSTPHSYQRILRSSLNNIFHNVNDRWGYPSVMVHVDPEGGESAITAARDRAFAFISRYAPEFQKSLGAKERPDAKKPVRLSR